MDIAACCDVQKPLRTDIGRACSIEWCACQAFLTVLVQLVENSMRLLPCQLVSFRHDRPEGNPYARAIRPTCLCGFRVDPFDLLLCFCKRLAPEPENVAQRTPDAIGGIRRTTDRN